MGKDDLELCDVARHKLLCSLWAVRYIEERESCALMPFHRAGAGRGVECEYDNVVMGKQCGRWPEEVLNTHVREKESED